MTSGSTGSIFPKWQLAVLVGAPLAFGLGYLYYKNQSTPFEADDDKSKSKDDDIEENTSDNNQPIPPKRMNGKESRPTRRRAPSLSLALDYKNIGNGRFKSGKYQEAINLYTLAINACPEMNPEDLATFYQNRAAGYEQLQKWSEVKEDCSKALELNPRYIKALHRRARAHECTNDLISSLEDITATCILEGFHNNSSLVFADRVLKELGRRDAHAAFNARVFVEPSTHFITAYFKTFTNDPSMKVEVKTGDDIVGFHLARKLLAEGKFEEVVAACTDEIFSNDPQSMRLDALLMRGTLYMISGQAQDALMDLTTIIETENAPLAYKANAYVKRAAMYAQNGHHEKGFSDFEKAKELDENNADIYLQRGQVYTLMERLKEAIADFDKAFELAPQSCSAYVQKWYVEYRLAHLNHNKEDLRDAIAGCENSVRMFPKNIETYNVLAQIYTEQQKYGMADDLFEMAIQMSPNVASLYVHRGLLYLQWCGDVEKAIELLHEAIEIDDKCELAYETLGTIQVQRGKLTIAIDLFEKALKLTRSEQEMVHLYSLRNAAIAQLNVAKKFGLDLSSLSALTNAGVQI